MQIYEVLEQALARIEDPNHWCVDVSADGEGRFCAIGAVQYSGVSLSGQISAETALIEAVRERYGGEVVLNNPRKAAQFDYSEYPESGIVAVNNMIGHEAVVECFKLAIRREKEKAGVAVEIPEQTHGDTAERAQQLVEENRAVLAALAPSDG